MSRSSRPRVAAIVTEYRDKAHADVIVGKLLAGYDLHGVPTEPRIEVASMYLDQVPDNDMAHGLSAHHDVPIFDTIGEALTLGQPGINVDGVLLIGEHGDYPRNERQQIIYPRRRFFDAAVSAMIAGDRVVPIFIDKHLSWSFASAKRMVDTAERLGILLLAGSSIPLAWRVPGETWPLGTTMTEAVVAAYGPVEVYEFHALEGLQCLAERRAGGETGVAAVRDLRPEEFHAAATTKPWDDDLLTAALATLGVGDDRRDAARAALAHAFVVEYRDGLQAAILMFDGLFEDFAFAGRGDDGSFATRFALEPGPPFGHFTFLVRQIESLVLNGVAPYPVARTLLTTGILDAAMRSRQLGGERIATPELAIAYDPAAEIPDTGVGATPPFILA